MNIKYISPKTRNAGTRKFYRHKDNSIQNLKMYKVFEDPIDINNITNEQISDPNFKIPESIVPRNFISFIVTPTSEEAVSIYNIEIKYTKIDISWGDGTKGTYSNSNGIYSNIKHAYSIINKNYLIAISPSADSTINTINPENFNFTLNRDSKTKYINSLGQDSFDVAIINLYDQLSLEGMSNYALEKKTSLKEFRCYYGIIKSLPNGLFKDCPNLKRVSFSDSRKLASVPYDLFSYSPNIINLDSCFLNSYELTSIPNNLLKGCTKLESIQHIFNTSSIKYVPSDIFSRCIISNANYAFYNCEDLTYAPSLWTLNIGQHTKTFYNTINATNYAEIPSDWK